MKIKIKFITIYVNIILFIMEMNNNYKRNILGVRV